SPGLREASGAARRGSMPFCGPHVPSKLSCRCELELNELALACFSGLLVEGRGSPASMDLADSSTRISIADIELAYRITGRGKPVILVHGLACGQRMWFHQRRKLSDRHTVITYDQ